MNSGTSTESQALQPWQLFTLLGLLGATVVVFFSSGQTAAGVILLSFIIFAAAVVGAAAWRTLAPLVDPLMARLPRLVSGRTLASIEREKTLVLRSIKELEFDRAMGKVSDQDFAEMNDRLRSRAARLMLQLDAGGAYRGAIEKAVGERLASAEARRPGAQGETRRAADEPGATPAASQSTTKMCPSCCTLNDVDARFCKGCGYNIANL